MSGAGHPVPWVWIESRGVRMDGIEELADRRDEFDRMSQRLERAGTAAKGSFTGKDASGCVTVVVSEVGHFEDVRVTSDWREDLSPATLAGAVMDARTAAAMTRMGDWGNALANEMDGPPPTLRPMPPLHESLAGRIEEFVSSGAGPEETRAATEAMAEFLREVLASIDQATAEVERVRRLEVAGASEGGHVRVVVTGTGDVTSVRYDEAWLERAHPVNIGRETVQAQRAALRAVGGRDAAGVLASTRLGELEALTRDPEAFARRLRMRPK